MFLSLQIKRYQIIKYILENEKMYLSTVNNLIQVRLFRFSFLSLRFICDVCVCHCSLNILNHLLLILWSTKVPRIKDSFSIDIGSW